LNGLASTALPDREAAAIELVSPGVHFWPSGASRPFPCDQLILADRECREFFVPNGAYQSNKGQAEFIDYGSGRTQKVGVPHFERPPAPLPKSVTHGIETLDVQSNIFGNLPLFPRGYVERVDLQQELELRLRDRNHPIITLHGRGGIGKTSLALWAAHKLAAENKPLFEMIVWFSARDVDLGPTGPKTVRPAVITLEDVSRLFGRMAGVGTSLEEFAQYLELTTSPTGSGNLFIFDNFETLADVTSVHRFLDTHTHIPNKVLITSRERAFKADFPVEVGGMSFAEAAKLAAVAAAELSIGGLIDDRVIDRLYKYSEGHPYLLRILIGEMAKEGRFVPPRSAVPLRMDVVDAVFERSFHRLSDAGRRVFLTVSNWRSAVSELALLVVLGRDGVDVESGIEECIRLSLVMVLPFADDQRGFTAPQLARVFGQKKLHGDPDRLLIQADLNILQRFGVVPVGQPVQVPEDGQIAEFVSWCVAHPEGEPGVAPEVLDSILLCLAELWPSGWAGLAQFRLRRGIETEDIDFAWRRAVEENPSNKQILLLRASYARSVGDDATWIASRIRAVEIDPADLSLLLDVAVDLNYYIRDHSAEIPPARRGVYLASIRDQMVKQLHQLDATGLSRLAWLYLLGNEVEEAAKYARLGLEKDPFHVHCLKLTERLGAEGSELRDL
jgi:hypothetical protein